jgi:hypothetical protein
VPVIITGIVLYVGAHATTTNFGVPSIRLSYPEIIDLLASYDITIDRVGSYVPMVDFMADYDTVIERAASLAVDVALEAAYREMIPMSAEVMVT